MLWKEIKEGVLSRESRPNMYMNQNESIAPIYDQLRWSNSRVIEQGNWYRESLYMMYCLYI
jgi:hypothetical protein